MSPIAVQIYVKSILMCSQSILQVKLWSWDVWGDLCELFVLWFAITLKKTTQSNQINIFRNFAFGRRNSTQSSGNLLTQNHGLTFYTFHYNNWDVLIYLPRAWAIWIFDISTFFPKVAPRYRKNKPLFNPWHVFVNE